MKQVLKYLWSESDWAYGGVRPGVERALMCVEPFV